MKGRNGPLKKARHSPLKATKTVQEAHWNGGTFYICLKNITKNPYLSQEKDIFLFQGESIYDFESVKIIYIIIEYVYKGIYQVVGTRNLHTQVTICKKSH